MKDETKKVKLLKRIDVNKINIRRDHYFPDAYTIDLPLDSTPDHIWQDIFEREWKSSRRLWDRKVFVIGDKLRLATPLNDIKEKLDWIGEVIKRTNKGIDEYHQEAEGRKTQMAERARTQISKEEKANIERIGDILRKRFGAL